MNRPGRTPTSQQHSHGSGRLEGSRDLDLLDPKQTNRSSKEGRKKVFVIFCQTRGLVKSWALSSWARTSVVAVVVAGVHKLRRAGKGAFPCMHGVSRTINTQIKPPTHRKGFWLDRITLNNVQTPSPPLPSTGCMPSPAPTTTSGPVSTSNTTPEQAIEEATRFDEVRPPHQKIGPVDDLATRDPMQAAMDVGGSGSAAGGAGGGGDAATLECHAAGAGAGAEGGQEDWGPYCRSLFKSPRQIRWQLRLEWALLRREWRWVVGLLLIEWFHLICRNLVYYIQVFP